MVWKLKIPPIIPAGLAIAAGLVAMDGLVTATVGTEKAERFPIDYDRLEEAGSNLAAIEKVDAIARDDRPKNIVFGLSTALTDVDPKVLTESDGSDRQWVTLGVMGTRLSRLDLLAKMLVTSKIQSDIIVLALSPGHFSRHPHERIFTAGPFEGPRGALRRHSWLLSARERGMAPQNELSLRLRLDLARMTGGGLASIFAPSAEPYLVSSSVRNRPLQAPVAFKDKPYYDLYCAALERSSIMPLDERINRQVPAFQELAAILTGRGRLIVCLMPEQSWMYGISNDPDFVPQLRKLLPPGAALADLRRWADDSMFYDPMHLNSPARIQFSKALPKLIAEALKSPGGSKVGP